MSTRAVEFGDSILLTEAAVAGNGVTLGRTSLVDGYLASGRLVHPLKDARPGDYSYYKVTTLASAERPRVQTFLNWLEDQVERDNMGTDLQHRIRYRSPES